MRKNLKDFRENHGDTTRLVLFQLAALTADYFLLLPRNMSTAKKVINGVCALALHGIAYKAAKHLETPKVQPTTKETADNKITQSEENKNLPARPATP